jgi:ribonuclease HII
VYRETGARPNRVTKGARSGVARSTLARVLVVGVDENGLGPRLGPLVATAVALDVSPRGYDPRRLKRAGARVGVGDSKVTSAFGAMAHAEGLALALVERLDGCAPESADALLAAVALDPVQRMRSPCDDESRPQCWGAPMPLPAFGGDVAAGRAILARLERAGARPVRARSAVACVRVYNRELARRGSKLCVDLELFERLLLDARGALGRDVTAICGMVGGIRRYPSYLARVEVASLETVEESASRSVYRAAGLGELRFEVDCDAGHLPVALASMLGKYVRELLVERQGRFYRGHHPELPAASGYHDPVTARFVAGTADLRRRLGIADDCFERTG